MKLTPFLTVTSVLSLSAFVLGLSFTEHASAFFGVSATVMLLMVAAQDYLRAPRTLGLGDSMAKSLTGAVCLEKHPLAA